MKNVLFFYLFAKCFKLFVAGPGNRHWVGMWWGGFLLCGLLLIIVAIPFFSFPKVLTVSKSVCTSFKFEL